MKMNNNKLLAEKLDELKRNKLKTIGITAMYTLVSIALFGGVGTYLDYIFNIKPVGMVIGLIISFPITQYFLYKKVKNLK